MSVNIKQHDGSLIKVAGSVPDTADAAVTSPDKTVKTARAIDKETYDDLSAADKKKLLAIITDADDEIEEGTEKTTEINDSTVALDSTWSSSKIKQECTKWTGTYDEWEHLDHTDINDKTTVILTDKKIIYLYDKTNDALVKVSDTAVWVGTEAELEAQADTIQAGTVCEITDDYDDIAEESTSLENVIYDDAFSFSGKTIQFFGDSITYGVGVDTDSSDLNLTNVRWTTRFCNIVGATETNNAVSGSLFTSGYNEVATIPNTIKATTLSGDCIFVCGGINDWQLGVPLSEFKTTIRDCFNYIKANYSGDVFIVAPFNAIKNLVGTPTNSIQEYRFILKKLALKFGFNFINGGNISLSPTRDAGNTIKYQYSDGLHPSGFGHFLIAKEMSFVFTKQNWETCYKSAGIAGNSNSEIYFTGKYLPNLGCPIWGELLNSLIVDAATTATNKVLDNRLTSSKIIIQTVTGCIMYNNDSYSAALPYYAPDQDYIKTFVFYTDGDGFTLQHTNTLAITNGNIFLEFIRYTDISNGFHDF